MAYETSYSVFEIRSIGNIRKTESEYVKSEYLKTLLTAVAFNLQKISQDSRPYMGTRGWW